MRGFLLLGVPAAALVFVLLNAAGFTPSPELTDQDFDRDGIPDAYELFFGLDPADSADAGLDYDNDYLSSLHESFLLTDPFYWDTDRDGFSDLIDSNAISRAYIRWGDPQFTTGDQYEYAHPDWLLGTYKNGGEWVVSNVWCVSEYGSNGVTVSSGWYVSLSENNGVASLNIDLDRAILTNNLRYAIHFSEGRAMASGRAVVNSSLFLDLLDTNGAVVVENLYGNLLVGSNVESAIILDVPTAKFSEVAIIQLRCGGLSSEALAKEEAEVIVYEGLLYIDEDGDGLDADQEKQLGTSDYCVDSNGNGTNDYDECFNTGSSTNNPDDDGGGDDGDDDGEDDQDGHKKNKIIYVDQAIGNDTYTGRASVISANKKGPKKTVRAGLAIAETNDTIVIRSGNYNEDLNIMGKDVKVFIEGKVRL